MKKGHIKENYKKRLQHRLKIIQGQLKGIEKMIENEAYCIDTLHQSLAVQESLKSFNALMLENHINTHLIGQLKGKTKEKAVKEMIKLYGLRTR